MKGITKMLTRRTFMDYTLRALALLSPLVAPLVSGINRARAHVKKTVIPHGTSIKTLVNKNPAELDTTGLDVTPLGDFGTMGLDDYKVNLDEWRLVVDGKVEQQLSFKYSDVLDLPSVEKTVLLICPGFFANNGRWKGVSVHELLKRAHVKSDAAYVTVRGPRGNYEKVEKFSLKAAGPDVLFLAYQVNESTLPQKHGFPLRLVAEGHYGSEWVKYVWNVKAE
jgi:DMSO/TMAO reductase YedYZ molybdopterin-dependent catalytic subunit